MKSEHAMSHTPIHDVKAVEIAQITQTITSVNHDINNILFGLMATAQLLMMELDGTSASVQQKLTRINDCCERIKQMNDRLAAVREPLRLLSIENEDLSCSQNARERNESLSSEQANAYAPPEINIED